MSGFYTKKIIPNTKINGLQSMPQLLNDRTTLAPALYSAYGRGVSVDITPDRPITSYHR